MLKYFNDFIDLILIATILLGLSAGSFLNVCIYRLPRHESIVFPPSHCPGCGKKIRWYDNIPLLSFILLKGRCRNCNEKISLRYPVTELLNCVLWVLMVFFSADPVQCIVGFAFSSLLILVSAIDLDKMIIPDKINLCIFILAVIRFAVLLVLKNNPKTLLIDLFAGAFSGSLLLLILSFLILKLTKKQALGGGDVKLAFACGALMGWKQVLLGIGLSAYIGLTVLLILALFKKADLKKVFPYGPFLSVGFLISYMFFDDILNWYMHNVL